MKDVKDMIGHGIRSLQRSMTVLSGQFPFFFNFERNYIHHGSDHKAQVGKKNVAFDCLDVESRPRLLGTLQEHRT